ncbi:MAG: alkaline shock response membrane anchor protein AmaP [Clostridia bacterium]|jgi:uncharacterized alkaline shock family protein YloU|nr:alkaline shock response membrane anchor protein AmaP [Clostridia bacterium]
MGSLKVKFTVGILSLGYIIASILFILISFGWFVPIEAFKQFLIELNNRWILGLTSFLVLIFALNLFINSVRVKPDKHTSIHKTALGQIDLSISALEQLIFKAAKKISGIHEVHPVLKVVDNKLVVLLKVQVNPDYNIPQITAELQHAIKDYLLQTSGTSIEEVKVQVTKINLDNKNSRVE